MDLMHFTCTRGEFGFVNCVSFVLEGGFLIILVSYFYRTSCFLCPNESGLTAKSYLNSCYVWARFYRSQCATGALHNLS